MPSQGLYIVSEFLSIVSELIKHLHSFKIHMSYQKLCQMADNQVYPFLMNGLSHLYHLDVPLSFLGASGVYNFILFFDEIQVSKQNSPRWDDAASHLGLFCLPMSHKKDARFIQVNISIFRCDECMRLVVGVSMYYGYELYILMHLRI